jgi:hypothetical protein
MTKPHRNSTHDGSIGQDASKPLSGNAETVSVESEDDEMTEAVG